MYSNNDRMERVLYNLHLQVCNYALRKTSRRGRNLAERLVLVLAVSCFGVLLLVHWSFVYRGGSSSSMRNHRSSSRSIPTSCLRGVPGLNLDVDVTHVSLVDANPASSPLSSSIANTESADVPPFNATCPMNRIQDDHSSVPPILFSYSKVKGYLLLPPELCSERKLKVQRISVSRSDAQCFGEPFLQNLVHWVTGADTVAMNWLLALHDATGFVWNPRTETVIDLEQYYNMEASVLNKSRWKLKNVKRGIGGTASAASESTHVGVFRQLLSKVAVVLKTSFLFYITTTLVSFTLRETQERMIDFTHRLRATYASTAAGEGASLRQAGLFPMVMSSQVAPLVVRHLAENLLFVPIMIGMIFFLIEFYRGDKFLAFMVVSLVWLCEVFTVISLRSSQGLHFFPRIFFLLFSLFHFYLFLYPFGFSYTAFASTVLFMMHSMLFFWHRYELPAVANGRVSLEQPRMAFSSPSPASIPSLDSEPRHFRVDDENDDHDANDDRSASIAQRAVPTVMLSERRQGVGVDSSSYYSDHHHRTDLSRPTSSVGLFHEDDSSSYLYFMDGEVVVHRSQQQHRLPHPPSRPTAPPPHSPASFSTISAGDRLQQQHVELLNDPMSLSGIPERISVTNSPLRRDLFRPSAGDDPPETSSLSAILQFTNEDVAVRSPPEAGGSFASAHNSTPRRDNRGGTRGPREVAEVKVDSSPRLRQRRVASAPNVPQLGRRINE